MKHSKNCTLSESCFKWLFISIILKHNALEEESEVREDVNRNSHFEFKSQHHAISEIVDFKFLKMKVSCFQILNLLHKELNTFDNTTNAEKTNEIKNE